MIVLVDPLAFECLDDDGGFSNTAAALVRQYATKYPVEQVYWTDWFQAGQFYPIRAQVKVITSPDRYLEWQPFLDPTCDLDLWWFDVFKVDRTKSRPFLRKDDEAKQRSKLWSTWQNIKDQHDEWLHGNEPPLLWNIQLPSKEPVDYQVVDNEYLSIAVDFIRDADDADTLYSLDFETDTLDHRTALAVGFSFSCKTGQAFYVPMRHADNGNSSKNVDLGLAKRLLQLIVSGPWLAHNAGFELAVLANEGIEIRRWPEDTLDICRLAGYPAGLKDAAKAILGLEMIRFDEIVGKSKKFSLVPVEVAPAYTCPDADYPLRIWNTLLDHADNDQISAAWSIYRSIYSPIRPILYAMEQRGVAVNQPAMEEWRNGLREATCYVRKWLAEQIGRTPDDFNPASLDQLQQVLFTERGYSPTRRTLKGYSTDEDTLLTLLEAYPDDPWLLMLMYYRESSKQLSTYAEPFCQTRDGRIRGTYTAGVSTTGRLASEEFNMQNIPTVAREYIVADDGRVFAGCDYSQIELRVLAHLSRSSVLRDTFQARESPHVRTLRDVFGISDKSSAPKQYTISKNINFGDIYGAGPDKLVEQARSGGVKVSVAEMREAQQKKRQTDPESWHWIQRARELAKERGWARTLQGRYNYNPGVFSDDLVTVDEAVRMLVNSEIQGSASLIAIEAMIEFEALYGDRWPIAIQVHDEIIAQCLESEADECLAALKSVMLRVASRYITFVPIEVEGHISKNWANLK